MKLNDTFRYLHIGLPENIIRLKIFGNFEEAVELIDRRLSAELPDSLRNCLTAEREMILRLPSDYPYDKKEALSILREHISDFSEEEFEECVSTGKIGWIYVKGEKHFFNRFFQSMCKTDPAFAVRAGVVLSGAESAGKDSDTQERMTRCICRMKEDGSVSNRIRIRVGVKVKDENFTPGMFVRVHLPIPAACEQQSEIQIESMYPEDGKIAPEDALQRTICWETTLKENQTFRVEYSYVHTAKYHDIKWEKDKTKVCQSRNVKAREKGTEFQAYLREEAPHILFTPYIRELAESLTDGIESPLEKARRFYDFITLHMKYTFMPSYFSLENIAENCARNFTGDCGVFALLFLTLCRRVGIPACWQSGFAAEPDFCGGHDWVRFYAEPYGWLYADPSYGVAAVRTGQEEKRRFYFGNLDPYRMVANNGFQESFTIDKQYFRADPYDNQVGEIVTAERGLRFEEYERSKEVLECEMLL